GAPFQGNDSLQRQIDDVTNVVVAGWMQLRAGECFGIPRGGKIGQCPGMPQYQTEVFDDVRPVVEDAATEFVDPFVQFEHGCLSFRSFKYRRISAPLCPSGSTGA